MSASLTLADLHNPENVRGIVVFRRGKSTPLIVEADKDQGFQFVGKMVQLWQLIDGRLLQVKAWRRSSILGTSS